jgi:hypothetical protein
MDINELLLKSVLSGGGEDKIQTDPYAAILSSRYSMKENPFGIGAMSLAGAIPTLASPFSSPGRNFASTVGASLLAALLGSVAKGQTDSANSLYDKLAKELLTAGTPEARSEIIARERRLSSANMAIELQQREQAAKAAEAQQKAQMDIETAIAKRMGMLPVFEEETKIRGKYNPAGTKVSVTTGETNPYEMFTKQVLDKAAEETAQRSELTFLSDKLKESGADSWETWGKFQLAKNFTYFDKEGIGILVNNNKDLLARLRSGAALNESEIKLYDNMIAGDITGTPQQVARLLDKLVASGARRTKSRMEFGQRLQTGNIASIYEDLDKEITRAQDITPPPRQPGETPEQYEARVRR